jgi:Peptidase M50B-like
MRTAVRLHQGILIGATLVGSWLGMQAVHECGHVLGAWLTGGRVERVVLNPLTISRTDLDVNPSPLLVVWAGPTFGVVAPLLLWLAAEWARLPGAFVLRFFAGFCLLANGLYVGVGSFAGVGDCGEMLRHGSRLWQLWLFGALTAPPGLWLWHRQGPHFGLGKAKGKVDPRVAYVSLAVCVLLLALGFAVGGE